jgi:deoxycytidylate deaminase
LTAQKIIQAGIAKVVYWMAYATDDASEKLLNAGGVVVEAHVDPSNPVLTRLDGV